MSHPSLPDEIVGIDVETTALDPHQGEIIEVSAIRYRLTPHPAGLLTGDEIGEFSALTKPAKPLSAQIIAITGITPEMVEQQQPFASIKDELQSFIGDSLLFAHNASFDTGFLSYYGLYLKHNPIWDTFTLSGIAWPQAPSYNLGMLAEMTGIKVNSEHRAGNDVRLTWQLLLKICPKFTVTAAVYEHIQKLLKSSSQTHYLPLFIASPARAREQSIASGVSVSTSPAGKPGDRMTFAAKSLEDLFSPQGPLHAALPNWQARPEQLAMAQAVENNIKEGKISLIEAGPGIGKTFAYLVPLIKYLVDRRQPTPPAAIISTHTKNLQDQLVSNDLPKIVRALHCSLRIASLKGRINYLCTARLKQAIDTPTNSPERAWLLLKLLIWLDHGGNGDLDSLNTSHQAAHILTHLHADALSCRSVCAAGSVADQVLPCPYHQARRAAREADIVVVNHALLMQLGGDDRVLPLHHVIIDEAHHLEEAAREATRVNFTEHRVAQLIAPFARLSALKTTFVSGNAGATRRRSIVREAKAILDDYRHLLTAMAFFLDTRSLHGRLRLTDSVRRSQGWHKISQLGTLLQHRLTFLSGLLDSSPARAPGNLKNDAMREAERFSLELERFLHGSSERVQWLEKGDNTVLLHDLALSIRPAVEQLMSRATSVTLTSATISIGGKFEYIKSRLAIPNADASQLPSSFDYKQQMLIYCIDDSVDPTSQDYTDYVSRQIERISLLLSGRVLGLFTSHDAIQDVYYKTLPALNRAQIKILAQGITGGRHAITSRFKKISSSILLGTYSFWEGVDVPGDSLSCVIIAKLPFAAPDDPLLHAIAESENKDYFPDLVVPQMILRLRQGVGRLIRSANDHGAIIILDSRFLNASYGNLVLKSLPPATVHIGSQDNLITWLAPWFGEQTLQNWQKGSHLNQ